MKRWYARDWTEYETVKDNDAKAGDVKEALEDAVHRQLMSDVPYGVLLSGGLDSSVTVSYTHLLPLLRKSVP